MGTFFGLVTFLSGEFGDRRAQVSVVLITLLTRFSFDLQLALQLPETNKHDTKRGSIICKHSKQSKKKEKGTGGCAGA